VRRRARGRRQVRGARGGAELQAAARRRKREAALRECAKRGATALARSCARASPLALTASVFSSRPDLPRRAQPLCHADIEAEKEGWLAHLLEHGCVNNPRNDGWRLKRGGVKKKAPAAKGAAAAAKGAKR
jgi:hypothetical protein